MGFWWLDRDRHRLNTEGFNGVRIDVNAIPGTMQRPSALRVPGWRLLSVQKGNCLGAIAKDRKLRADPLEFVQEAKPRRVCGKLALLFRSVSGGVVQCEQARHRAVGRT